MTRGELRAVAAAGVAGALLTGCAAVIYGSTRTAGGFAYEPLSGATYHFRLFGDRTYSSTSALEVARLRYFLAGAAVGLILGFVTGCIVAVRLTGRKRPGRRLGYSSAGGLLGGGIIAVLVHFLSRVILIPTPTSTATPVPRSAHAGWWPSALVIPLLGVFCGLALGLLAGNEKRTVTTTE